MLVWPELSSGGAAGRQFVGGVLGIQLACFGWALGTSYTKRHPSSGDPIAATTVQMLFSGTMLLSLATAAGEWAALHFTPRSLSAMIYLTVAGSVVAYTAYVYAVRHLPISTVSLYAYVNPMIAVALGSLLLGEPMTRRASVAGVLVLDRNRRGQGSTIDRVPRLPRLADLTADSAGWGFFLCASKERRTGRSGSEFLVLTLQDVSAQVTAKILDEPSRYQAEFDAGEFVRVEGKGSLYNGRIQLLVSSIRRVHPEQDRLEGFREDDCVLSAPRPIGEMWTELSARVAAVSDSRLRVLLMRILVDHEAQLREWPAAQVIHHAYRGGFLEHIVKMAEVETRRSPAPTTPTPIWCWPGSILHDIGKLQELSYESGTISYTREGNLVGHIALGLILVREGASGISGFPPELRTQLEHLVLSHHGTREHGSPVEPKTIEAFILASVDELDARINQVRRAVQEDAGDGEFTGWHKRLGRVLYKGPVN